MRLRSENEVTVASTFGVQCSHIIMTLRLHSNILKDILNFNHERDSVHTVELTS